MNEIYHDKMRGKDVRKAQDEKFNWVTEKPNMKNVHRSNADISINCIKYGGGTDVKGLSFTFRNDVGDFFGDYVQYAIYKNRIMFRAGSLGNGIPFGTKAPNKPTNKYFKVRIDESNKIIKEKFLGDFELKYDSFYELYYIEANFEA